jgi:hypothetical protein
MVGKLGLIAAIVAGLASGHTASSPPLMQGGDECPGPAATLAAATRSSPAAQGRGLAATHRDGLVMVAPSGERRAFKDPGPSGLLRHAASRSGVGTAYVNDVRGADVLVLMRPSGVAMIEGRGELTHPTWSPRGDLAWSVNLSAIEVWSPGTGARRLVPAPRGTSGIFSPVFTAADEMVAVVLEPVGHTHDDALNDLWRFELDGGGWSRLTMFEADADRWSVLRTPVMAPDGALLFVRVIGRASATEPPSFELWTLRGRQPSKVRDLPGEMYLAGFLGDRLVWNVPDPAMGDWRLVLEGPQGAEDLGCGAASVDPIAEPDPDLLETAEAGVPPDGEPGTGAPAGEPSVRLALLIGDFASEEGAAEVVQDLRIPGVLVVGHGAAPDAVRPGAWAVAVPIPDRSPPEEALAAFRARHPDLADRTWIVPFEPRGVTG